MSPIFGLGGGLRPFLPILANFSRFTGLSSVSNGNQSKLHTWKVFSRDIIFENEQLSACLEQSRHYTRSRTLRRWSWNQVTPTGKRFRLKTAKNRIFGPPEKKWLKIMFPVVKSKICLLAPPQKIVWTFQISEEYARGCIWDSRKWGKVWGPNFHWKWLFWLYLLQKWVKTWKFQPLNFPPFSRVQ